MCFFSVLQKPQISRSVLGLFKYPNDVGFDMMSVFLAVQFSNPEESEGCSLPCFGAFSLFFGIYKYLNQFLVCSNVQKRTRHLWCLFFGPPNPQNEKRVQNVLISVSRYISAPGSLPLFNNQYQLYSPPGQIFKRITPYVSVSGSSSHQILRSCAPSSFSLPLSLGLLCQLEYLKSVLALFECPNYRHILIRSVF